MAQPGPVCMAKAYNYDTDSDNDSLESDGDESPTPKKPQLAQECPAPVYMAKACWDTTEPNERCVLSLYDSIGCLAQHDGIKDNYFSSLQLGYTKYIALEPDHELRTIAQRKHAEQWTGGRSVSEMAHGLKGSGEHAPQNTGERHIKSLQANSIKLFAAVAPEGKNYEETLTYILGVWSWVKTYNKNCEFLIQAYVTHRSDQELQCIRAQAMSCFGKPHFIQTHSRTTLIQLGQLNGGPISAYQWHGTPPSVNFG